MTKSVKTFVFSAGILIAAFLLGMFAATKIFGPDPAYWVKKEKYLADVADANKKTDVALVLIAEKDAEISGLHADLGKSVEKIKILQGDDAAATSTIASLEEQNLILKESVAAVIAMNPAVRALFENYEALRAEDAKIIFSLRAQVKELGPPTILGYDEAGKPILEYPKGTITGNLFDEILATRAQRNEWKRIADRREALLATANSLIADNERRLARGKFWKYVAYGETIVFGGIGFYQFVRRK